MCWHEQIDQIMMCERACAHSARQSSFPRVSLVQGENDRINKRVFVDNSPPVGNRGSPRPRVKISLVINVSFDKKPISQIDTNGFFGVLEKSLLSRGRLIG